MAKVITICCNKGGTGKTTTAINTAAALRYRGFNVLVVDFDGQANATDIMGIVPADGRTIYAAMGKRTPWVEPVRVMEADTVNGVLDVLPSCPDLSALEAELSKEPDRVTRFTAVVDRYREKYDYIIIDTPPLMGLLLISSLYAADGVIIPMSPEYLDLRGVVRLIDGISSANAYRAEPLAFRILFTKVDTRKGLHKTIIDQTAAKYPTFSTIIRNNITIAEAQAAQTLVFEYAPKSNGTRDYLALAEELTRI